MLVMVEGFKSTTLRPSDTENPVMAGTNGGATEPERQRSSSRGAPRDRKQVIIGSKRPKTLEFRDKVIATV
jgi:hypothetical protein